MSRRPLPVVGSPTGLSAAPAPLARLLVPLLAALACAPAAGPAAAPAPEPTPPPAAPAAAANADVVPPFRTTPLAVWGPTPPGTSHLERGRTYDLQHQVVRVAFDWKRHAVVGETTLRVAPLRSPLEAVALDAVGMRIVDVRGASGASLRRDYDGRTLTVHLATPLPPGRTTSIVVRYEAVAPKKGAYFIDRRHVLWTQGETEDTRYWVPTYDYPNDKTTWEFYIRVPKQEKALSNGRLAGTRALAGGDVEWHWVQDRPASTYLMTAATGDFVILQDKWKDVPVGYWTYPDSVQAAWRGFGKTPRMVDYFSTSTGVAYPWAKYDQVVAPDYIFGGMENVSATTQADDAILHPAWAEPQANADGLVAHELGHQWYGDLLTTRDWAHVWLNEGFATFMEQSFIEHDRGADEGALERLDAQQEVIDADTRARRGLVFDRWVTDPLELFFSGHIYPKGATVLQMLRHQLGDSLFWRAMNRYTVDHAYANVVSGDLERAFTQTTGRDFAPFFLQWVYGAGYPAFRVSYVYDAASRRLTLTAEQVQPRDSLTGYFDADVDVEVLTDAGPVRAVVPVRSASRNDAVTRAELTLPAPPRSIHWDKGGWLLDVTDFPRSTSMLAWQLAHDDDVLGRMEGVRLLVERGTDSAAVGALTTAARSDRFWAVRQRAAGALGAIAGRGEPAAGVSATLTAALLGASGDGDARVREEAATALGALAGRPAEVLAPVAERRRARARADSSRFVRGAAFASYAAVAPDSALGLARVVMGRESWTDIERTRAIAALGLVDRPGVIELLAGVLRPVTSRSARTSAIEALVARRGGHEEEIARLLVPQLAADDIFVRIAAANALGRLGQRSSIAALEARRRVEAESRVVNEIDAALQALTATGR